MCQYLSSKAVTLFTLACWTASLEPNLNISLSVIYFHIALSLGAVRLYSVEDYVSQWVFVPSGFYPTGFFVADSVLMHCKFCRFPYYLYIKYDYFVIDI